MAIVETFTTQRCSAGSDADHIFNLIATEYGDMNDVIMINCNADDTGHQTTQLMGCQERVSLYFNNRIIDRSALPTTIMNGQFDVRATNETHMRQAVDMVKSLKQIPRIDLIYRDDRIIFTAPDTNQYKDRIYGWLVGYTQNQINNDDGRIEDGAETNPTTNLNVTTFVQPIHMIDQPESLVVDVKSARADAYAVLFQKSNSRFIAAGKIVVRDDSATQPNPEKIN